MVKSSNLFPSLVNNSSLVKAVNEKGKEYGMSTNIKKTKVMVVTKKEVAPSAKIPIGGKQ